MIIKNEIIAVGSAALREAFRHWLNDNREAVLRILKDSLSAGPPDKSSHTAQPEPTPPLYLRTSEVASRWGCCVHTVLRKIRSGELACLRMNRRHILVPIQAILELEKNATG